MAHKNIPVDEFSLAEDLSKLNFSMHIGEERSKEGEAGAKTLFYGGKQAALESAGDDLDREFFKMNNVEGKLNTPFHTKAVENSKGSGGKKHNKKNKKQDKKLRVVGY